MIIGREAELAKLKSAAESAKAEFIAVYGRRRIGKTFLIRQAFRIIAQSGAMISDWTEFDSTM